HARTARGVEGERWVRRDVLAECRVRPDGAAACPWGHVHGEGSMEDQRHVAIDGRDLHRGGCDQREVLANAADGAALWLHLRVGGAIPIAEADPTAYLGGIVGPTSRRRPSVSTPIGATGPRRKESLS